MPGSQGVEAWLLMVVVTVPGYTPTQWGRFTGGFL